MDYKFLILFISIILVGLYVFRELDTFKKNMELKVVEVNETNENNLNKLRSKIQTDLQQCVAKIKTHNIEFINEARKMKLISAQPITNVSNNYSEEDHENALQYQYLSDIKKDTDKQQRGDSQYMSDRSNFDINIENNVQKTNEDKHDELSKITEEHDDNNDTKEKPKGEEKVEENNKKEEEEEENEEEEEEEEEEEVEKKEVKIIKKKEDEVSGRITLGSTKNKGKGEKPVVSGAKKNADTKSIRTNEITPINLKALRPIEQYKKEELDTIAKVYSIPTIYKTEDGKRAFYKKDELYSKIKTYLSKLKTKN